MACSREGTRIAGMLLRRQFPPRAITPSAGRFASNSAGKQQLSSNKTETEHLAELDPVSSFSTPLPDEAHVGSFDPKKRGVRETQLPGNRYQYHPPKYDRGPLHPIQSPPSSDPTARDFVPGPFNHPRLRHTLETTVAPDLLTLTYQHTPPGTVKPVSQKGELRTWDGSSPYHKNRPRRGPRGPGSDRLPLLERNISPNNIPEIKGVSVSVHAPRTNENKEWLHTARAVLLAITGQFPKVNVLRTNVVQFKVKKGDVGGAHVNMTGNAAYEFIDKLVTLVLPKIKEWPGVKATSGDGHGNLSLGLTPDVMAYFPELEFNYAAYPSKMIPGCYITIQTTATSDRQGRLLMEALGIPFDGKAKN